jgi:chromosome segregation ATPase
MAKMTLEKLHSLLEGLAEHVMSQMPTKQEMNERFGQVDARFEQIEADIQEIKIDIHHMKGDMHDMKGDIMQTKGDVKTILNGMDAQAKQLDVIRIEQAAFSRTIDRHEKRITALEEKE